MPTFGPFNRNQIHENFYRESISQYSPSDVRALKWNSRESQENRFFSLIRIGNLDNARILDIGCGTGDLLGFLQSRQIYPAFYEGIDLIPEFLEIARKKYPRSRFSQKDFFQYPSGGKLFDYVLCNGALNVRERDNRKILLAAMKKALSLAGKGAGFTLLKQAEGYENDPRIFHYREEEVEKMAKGLSVPYQILSDYADNDFTVFLWNAR